MLLGAVAASLVAATLWFFIAGQYIVAEPAVSGPSEAPVFDAAWMKPVTPAPGAQWRCSRCAGNPGGEGQGVWEPL